MVDTREVTEAGGKPLPRGWAIKVQIKRTNAGIHGFPGQNVTTNSCNKFIVHEYIVQVEGAKDAAMKPPARFTMDEMPVVKGPGRGRAKGPLRALHRYENETRPREPDYMQIRYYVA